MKMGLKMSKRKNRLIWVLGGFSVVVVASFMVVNAFQSSLVFFFTPTEISEGKNPSNKVFRVGGVVLENSIQKKEVNNTLNIDFVITDGLSEVPVRYIGILPSLFQESKGVVAQGMLDSEGVFMAQEVLAKHDENYMPPEAQHAMDQAQGKRVKVEAP